MGTFKTTNLTGMFDELSGQLSKLHVFEMDEELEQVKSTYSTMLHYMVKGVEDPNSRKIYMDLKRRCHVMAHRSRRLSRLSTNNDDKYVKIYNSSKSFSLQNQASMLESQCKRLNELESSSDIRESIKEHDFKESIDKRQESLNNLFNLIWTSDTWSSADYETMSSLLNSNHLHSYEKGLLVSAVTMGLLEMFDEKKLMYLFDGYLSDDLTVGMRSIVGIVLALRLYDSEIAFFPSIQSRLSLFVDNDSFVSDVYMVLMQLQYSKLTQKVSDKMRNDIIPTLLQSGKFKKTEFGLKEIDDYMTQNGENPEWHQLDKSDEAYSKIQEMTEMQMEGADVYMSTFNYMKSDPFFHVTSNWFMPFSESHPSIHSTFQSMGNIPSVLKEMLNHAPFCNSDKYSFTFMLSHIGSLGQEMMVKNLGEGMSDDDMKEQLKEMRDEKRKGSDISRQYIQDLYRFFMIYPFHRQFVNPFDESSPSFTPLATDSFSSLLSHRDEVLNLAEFMMRKELYQDALDLFFTLTPQEHEEDATIWQKIGFCQQKKSDYESALYSYTTAYTLNPDSKWTLKHLARVAYQSKHFDEAEAYYDMLLIDDEDNLKYLKLKANCMTESRRYEEAVQLLYKISYLDEHSLEVRSELAFCLFMSGRSDKSKEIYHVLSIEDPGNVQTLVNLANVYYCNGELETAYTYYSEAYHILQNEENGKKQFKRMFVDAAKQIKQLGVDVDKFQMIYDAVVIL